jgi:hypothetical protein
MLTPRGSTREVESRPGGGRAGRVRATPNRRSGGSSCHVYCSLRNRRARRVRPEIMRQWPGSIRVHAEIIPGRSGEIPSRSSNRVSGPLRIARGNCSDVGIPYERTEAARIWIAHGRLSRRTGQIPQRALQPWARPRGSMDPCAGRHLPAPKYPSRTRLRRRPGGPSARGRSGHREIFPACPRRRSRKRGQSVWHRRCLCPRAISWDRAFASPATKWKCIRLDRWNVGDDQRQHVALRVHRGPARRRFDFGRVGTPCSGRPGAGLGPDSLRFAHRTHNRAAEDENAPFAGAQSPRYGTRGSQSSRCRRRRPRGANLRSLGGPHGLRR